MRRLSSPRWWILFATVLFIVAAWPPDRNSSLLLKAVNWIVDPGNRLPVLPPQLGYGLSDDLATVEARDAEVRRYDQLHAAGGLTRARLLLKVAQDPFDPSTTRQLLLLGGVAIAFLVSRNRTA